MEGLIFRSLSAQEWDVINAAGTFAAYDMLERVELRERGATASPGMVVEANRAQSDVALTDLLIAAIAYAESVGYRKG
jgi:hypothetical protein